MRSHWLRWLGQLVVCNLGIAAALGVTLWLGRYGIVLPGYLVGVFAGLLPGLLLTLIVEQLTNRSVVAAQLVLWAAISSLTLIPGLVFIVDRFVLSAGSGVLMLLPAFGIVWLALLVSLILLTTLHRVRSGLEVIRLTRKDCRELLLITGGFFLVFIVNAWLYPYLPEADGYGYLIKLRDAVSQPDILAAEPRILFLTFVSLVSSLTGADQYLVLKFFLPGLFILVVFTCYLVARTVLNSSVARIVAAISPLAFPVILQEMLISRPQSLVLLTFVPALYLVGRVAQPAAIRDSYWLLLLFAIGIVGMKIHTLMVLALILALAGAVRMFWPLVRAQPMNSLVSLALLFLLALPWLQSMRIIGDILHIANLIWQAVSQNRITLWFIDQYHNVDGAQMGWPGVSWLFYYGYNLGIFFPILVATVGFGWQKVVSSARQIVVEWPALLIGLMMLSIAELFPRFGLAYLPDRAWLFVVLCLSLLLPYMLASQLLAHRRAIWVWSLLLCCSLAVGSYVTYAKQGWVTRSEYAAVPFIHVETPPTAIFLGQGASRPAIRYFANRRLMTPPSEVFLSHDQQVVERYLEQQQVAYELAFERRQLDRATLGESFQQLGVAISQVHDESQGSALKTDAQQLVKNLEDSQSDRAELEDEFVLKDRPVYILYDRTKFDSLYGQRFWWRASNFYGADTDKFSQLYPVVYDQAGVMIWKVR